MARMSYNQRRVIVAAIWVPGTFCLVNYVAGFQLLGGYDRYAAVASFVALLLAAVFIVLPGYPEVKEQWELKRKAKNRPK